MATGSTKSPALIDENLALSILPHRPKSAHKWSVGGVVIIGGAPGYIGAPALCARAAMRSGAGIVSVAVARSSIGPIAGIVPEATFVPLPEGDPLSAAVRGAEAIRARADKSKAIVAGPGLSDDEHASALLAVLFGMKGKQGGGGFGFGRPAADLDESNQQTLLGGDIPAVIDADALNWLSTQPEWWKQVAPQSMILTPHTGEMARLVEREAAEIDANPVPVAVESAKRWNQVVLLKGPNAVVTDGKSVLTGPESTRSLASAGTGDVLAGSIGAFLAQGLSLLDACVLAIWAGSHAAELVEENFGTLGLLAGDLPDAIGLSLASLERRGTS